MSMMLVWLALAQVALVLSIKPTLTCFQDESCKLSLTLETGKTHEVELIPQQHSLFSSESELIVSGKRHLISDRKTFGKRYHSKFSNKFWATALLTHDKTDLKEGIFLTEDGIFEVEKSPTTGEHTHRRVLTDKKINDFVFDLPFGKPWKGIKNKTSSSSTSFSSDAINKPASQTSGVIPFFPNCYPEDSVAHNFHMSVALDYGVYLALAPSGASQQDAMSAVLSSLESQYAVGQLVFISQLNIKLILDQVVVGQPSDQPPLSRAPSTGTCLNALSAFTEATQYIADPNNGLKPTAYVMLVSECYQGIDGVSYVGSACGPSAIGITAFSWIVFFHELGHGIGLTHTFENGIGTTGGLMDYANGLYDGVPQYHPFNQPEACEFFTYLSSTNCPYFQISNPAANCGDGILSETEECECLNSSTSCGACVNCKLTDPSVECSAADFVVRTPITPSTLIVQASSLSDPNCCINNRFSPPKTLCGGGLDACGPYGVCHRICTKFLLTNNPNCGFDSSGCQLGCVWNNQCSWDMTYTNPNTGAQDLVSALPDGSPCYMGNSLGVCTAGTCALSGSPTVQPTPAPTLPTAFPTPLPTVSHCGNGLLEPDYFEECECLQKGSQNCGQCVMCKLVDPSIECSTAQFIVQSKPPQPIITAQLSALSDTSCCVNGRFAPPKTLCENGLNVCGGNGKCSQVCTAFLLPDNPNCGFDSSGCLLGCVWNNQCRFDMTYSSNGQNDLVSAVPDNTPCYKNNLIGSCSSGSCQVSNQDVKGYSPTAAPTSSESVTNAPSASVGSTQNNSPSQPPSSKTKSGHGHGHGHGHGRKKRAHKRG